MVLAFIPGNERSHDPRFTNHTTGRALLAVVMTLVFGAGGMVEAQDGGPGELVRKLSGHWKLNVDLTPVAPKTGGG